MAKKKPTRRKSATPRRAADRSVTVRMFCQGLGDCFLVTIPQGGTRPYSILIDCGVAMGTPNADAIMKQVAAGIAKLTQGTVDLLVVTHQHWDHVSGFVHAAAELSGKNGIEFKHVWFAWTENGKDPLVQTLRAKFGKAKLALARAFQAKSRFTATDPMSEMRLASLEGVLAFLGPGAATGTDAGPGTLAEAMAFPRQLVKADENPEAIDYLLPGRCETLPGARGGLAAGIQAIVLGPPHDAPKLMKVNPGRRTPETYDKRKGDLPGLSINWAWLASAMTGDVPLPGIAGDPDDAVNQSRSQPFDPAWGMPLEEAERHPFFSKRYFSTARENEGRRIDGDWLWSGAQRLALQMDSYTNNTSLVLAFELPTSKRVLLFAADAQVGNWLSWHERTYETTDGRVLSAADLLANTVLYKVGHHGSHNATLKAKGLELMTHPHLVAMLPVEADGVARLGYGQMPLKGLVKALSEATEGRLLRLDQVWEGATAPGTWPKSGASTAVSKETITVGKEGHTSQRPLYMELVLEDA
jgi:hypothetical protein